MQSSTPNTRPFRPRQWLSDNRWQALAFVFCVLFGAALIANIQLAGEASWFWYATLMHRGVRLYADLHLPLQPFFVLETDAWMILVGRRLLPYETLAFIHVALLCLGMLLILRECSWPDWKKAPIFAAAFVMDILFSGIRFDDFHVVSQILGLFSLVLLLRMYRAQNTRSELLLAAVLGIFSGICFTNRSTDGATLLMAVGGCVLIGAPRRKILSTALVFALAALTIGIMVHLTGDTFHSYLTNSVLHAAAAKGGTTSVLHSPFVSYIADWMLLFHSRRMVWFIAFFAIAAIARRLSRNNSRTVILSEAIFCIVTILVLAVLPVRSILLTSPFIAVLNEPVQAILFPACVLVFFQFVLVQCGRNVRGWNPLTALIFVPAASMLSDSFSQATGTSNDTISLSLVFLLATLWLPSSGRFRWFSDTVVVIAWMMAATGFAYKIVTPYGWQNYVYKPMFVGRQVYEHPIYGFMYIDSDLLHFSQPICQEIRDRDPSPQPELLSLPYSYSNYFCNTPPWHNYVQTWFDTTTPDTIRTLMNELNQHPPRWILYQRELDVLRLHEVIYSGGRPIMHRKLDELIMAKLADGEWKLVDRRDYLKGDGWYLIQTHP